MRLTADNKVAIKVLDKKKIQESNDGISQLITEIKAHWALEQCEGALKLLQIYETSCFIMLVLEYQPNGSLMQMMKAEKQFKEEDVRVIMEQALLALDFF